ncbi:hypothetical protein [Phascolarctid gammaherpesvirus 1]|uniref:Uncharacterized protein n=1 Tax=Phascolarctid gammaherpesvirus 1 TaxID=2249313 RepID=A0A3S8D7P7_9GAMA|nr:hypothetical protein KM711_gp26 [Phascolarctid gammaherpesvirus 1]AZB49202.1 hypothetical protein [Phascolarctid gammaherpesvirus 1]
MSVPVYSERKNIILDSDFSDCEQFFSKSLPDLISDTASSLSSLRTTDSPFQRLELICTVMDIVGTECMREVTNVTRALPQKKPTDTIVTTGSSMPLYADTTE